MAVIKVNFGEGGANLTPTGSAGDPTLAVALRDVADDLVGTQIAAIVSANATDLPEVITLANEIKAAINAAEPAAYILKTIKG